MSSSNVQSTAAKTAEAAAKTVAAVEVIGNIDASLSPKAVALLSERLALINLLRDFRGMTQEQAEAVALRLPEEKINSVFEDLSKQANKILEIDKAREKAQSQSKAALETANSEEETPWYKTTTFYVSAGVVGAAAVVGGVLLYNSMQDGATEALPAPSYM